MADSKPVSVNRGWLLLWQDMGVDAGDVLRRAQLPEDLFLREDAKISVKEYFRLWNASAAALGDPAVAIRVAEAVTVEAFNPMVFAALCSPDLSVAMERIASYKRLIVPMSVMVEMRSEGLVVSKRWDDDGESLVPPSLAAADLVMLVQIARIGLRERIVPVRVTSHLPMEPIEIYTSYFGVRPTRGATRSVTFHPQDARKPFLTASADLWQTFEPSLQLRLTKLDAEAPLRERIRSVLLESLPSGEVSIEATARRLGLSPRTLQRRLQPEGTSFKQIVRGTREELARHYLTKTQLGYTEISFLIGFDEPSSFFRAFREWTGVTPESMRMEAATH